MAAISFVRYGEPDFAKNDRDDRQRAGGSPCGRDDVRIAIGCKKDPEFHERDVGNHDRNEHRDGSEPCEQLIIDESIEQVGRNGAEHRSDPPDERRRSPNLVDQNVQVFHSHDLCADNKLARGPRRFAGTDLTRKG